MCEVKLVVPRSHLFIFIFLGSCLPSDHINKLSKIFIDADGIKFKEFDINPEQAIVGTGIASLNPMTGLEQFGFFKKIGKALKKVAKKIAPVAGPLANFIPGVGPVLAGAIGAATNVAAGKGLKGAITGGLSGFGGGGGAIGNGLAVGNSFVSGGNCCIDVIGFGA